VTLIPTIWSICLRWCRYLRETVQYVICCSHYCLVTGNSPSFVLLLFHCSTVETLSLSHCARAVCLWCLPTTAWHGRLLMWWPRLAPDDLLTFVWPASLSAILFSALTVALISNLSETWNKSAARNGVSAVVMLNIVALAHSEMLSVFNLVPLSCSVDVSAICTFLVLCLLWWSSRAEILSGSVTCIVATFVLYNGNGGRAGLYWLMTTAPEAPISERRGSVPGTLIKRGSWGEIKHEAGEACKYLKLWPHLRGCAYVLLFREAVQCSCPPQPHACLSNLYHSKCSLCLWEMLCAF